MSTVRFCCSRRAFQEPSTRTESHTLPALALAAGLAILAACGSGTGGSEPKPAIVVTDPLGATDDHLLPFGPLCQESGAYVTISNSGEADLVLGPIGSIDPLEAPFGFSNEDCSGQPLRPGGSCRIDIDFSPVTVAAFNDSFDIPSNDPAAPSVTVNLSGCHPAGPVMIISDSVPPTEDGSIPFGNILLGESDTQTVTVSNTGDDALVIGTIGELSAPFSIIADACSGESIPPSSSCEIAVRFEPTSPGSLSDTFSIPYYLGEELWYGRSAHVSGTGVFPAIEVTDSVAPADDHLVLMGPVAPDTHDWREVYIRNIGTGDLRMGTIALADPLAPPFSFDYGEYFDCSGYIIPPGYGCTLTIEFGPTVSGLFLDHFDIPSSDPSTPVVTVSLRGQSVVP